jgi:spartin
MASGHNVCLAFQLFPTLNQPPLTSWQDPKLLYAINGINAYHIENGKEESLTPSGPQTLSLLMVPTSSPFSGLSSADPQSQAPEEDFYLHLHLPPELDLPLPATTQIYHQPPNSYLIPRWDLGPDSGAFTRIEFPGVGKGKGSQEDVDTFETILAQCTAFLERAQPPKGARPKRSKSQKELPLPAYDPSNFKPGEAYVPGSSSSHQGGQIVLIDEENGSVVGELGEGFHVVEDAKMRPGSKGQYTPDITQVYLAKDD